jgi:EF hand.
VLVELLIDVSLENLRKKFSSIYSWKEIEKKFEEFDKDKDGVLNLKEFVDIILPPDFYLDPALIKDISS